MTHIPHFHFFNDYLTFSLLDTEAKSVFFFFFFFIDFMY